MNKNNQSRTIVTSKYIFVFVGAVILLTVIVWKHNYDLRILKQEYISANNIQVTKVANSIEDNFKLFKQGLQTIAHLPDVKDINEDGSNVGSNAKISIQEIYNALAANITVSEIYITTSHLGEHDEKNLVFNNVHSPVLSFDNEMDGSFHDDSSELEEYKLIASQTAWANKYFPEYLEHNEKQFVSGPEVQICDSRTIPDVKRSKEKNKGIVLSTPFYGSDNKLRGMVSGIIQSDVVRKMLPDKYLYLVNKTYGYSIGLRNEKNYQPDKELLMNALPDNALIYSNVMRVHLPDKSSEWYLWAGYPDSLFWEQNMVKSDNKFLALTLTMVV
ncbi:MAG: hypothetical protein OEX83_04190, partial [Gammaproteobacteria bacterium]|nr:hypothetical protein [Gammaproteobacteria bacterium]